jgi:hypothetical protein
VGQPVLGPSGELLQFVRVSMDVSASKQAEEAFRLIVVGRAATTVGTSSRVWCGTWLRHCSRYAFVTTCDDQKHARTLAFWKGDGFGENFEFDIADTPCDKVLNGELCHYRQGLRACSLWNFRERNDLGSRPSRDATLRVRFGQK